MAANALLPTRDAIVATAGESIARGSQSFALASRLFDRPTRERAWLLYAWCRRCDDLADGQDHGGTMGVVDDPAERLALISARTERALAGEVIGDPAFDALRIVAAECRIPPALPRDLVQGFALDAADWRPRTEADLLTYCYHVAGSVGVMMAIVMGVDPEDSDTLDRACDLGLAFQLANIARDVAEDAAAGRCYLPLDWLAEFGIAPGEQMDPRHRDALAAIAARLAERAEAHEASARIGAARLPFRARWAVLAAAGIYGDIARKVRARGAHAWDRRTVTGKGEKLAWVMRAWAQARMGSPGTTPRDGLWTRPATA
ncbi:MAG: phytoene/squalene synthase family protein [Sphingobium sp.]